MKIVGVVASPNQSQTVPDGVDVIELRLDQWPSIVIDDVKAFMAQHTRPVILTLRSKDHGGSFEGSESERLALLFALAKLAPTYMDIEHTVDSAWITQFKTSYPDIQIIRSFHDFCKTPDDLEGVLSSMQHPDVSIYKVATTAQSTLDVLRVMHFVKQHSPSCQLVAHAMGSWGVSSRVVGAVLGNVWSYAACGADAAPGCPDVRTWIDLYRIKRLKAHSDVYALLGDPVSHSIGDVFHNEQFAKYGVNAVYVKMRLRADELPGFFKLIQGLPFKGFSVTMPLKEKVLPFIDVLQTQVGAVNTIVIRHGKRMGMNTDAIGALDALRVHGGLAGRRVLILGAGGAAQAIAHACASAKPASLVIVNRTLSKALNLAESIGGIACDFASFQWESFDVVINTLPDPAVAYSLIGPYVSKGLLLMQVDYSGEGHVLLAKCHEVGCVLIDGETMFRHQAVRQLEAWLGHVAIR